MDTGVQETMELPHDSVRRVDTYFEMSILGCATTGQPYE